VLSSFFIPPSLQHPTAFSASLSLLPIATCPSNLWRPILAPA
jgi:hypothetical protein